MLATHAARELSRRSLPLVLVLFVLLVSALAATWPAPGARAAPEEGKAVFAVG